MNLTINNCNNIENGEFNIMEGRLNIKYAINGTGKSTISKAIDAFVTNDEEKKRALLPFKYYNDEDSHLPNLSGFEQIGKLQCLMKNILKIMFINQRN